MHWIENYWHHFNGLDELYHHAEFGEIEQRAAAVGAKIWCLYVCFVTLRGRRAVLSRDA